MKLFVFVAVAGNRGFVFTVKTTTRKLLVDFILNMNCCYKCLKLRAEVNINTGTLGLNSGFI